MKKAKNINKPSFSLQDSLESDWGFDEVARKKARERLDRCPRKNPLTNEDKILWMLILQLTFE